MRTPYLGELPSRPIVTSDHRSILALLPEYVTIRVLAQRPPPEWQQLEHHLRSCAICRSEADALMNLVGASYSGAMVAAPAPEPPDLSFLRPPTQSPITPRTNGAFTEKRRFQPIVIQFSGALLPRIRVQVAARSGGVHLRYAYEIPPDDDTSPTITVEVLVHDDRPAVGLVRVCVEHPDRSPFDQAGTRVVLQIDDIPWSGVTDPNGVVAFHNIPLTQMDRWQITIAPDETND